MSDTSLVYLSGPISGCSYTECTDWREYVTMAFPPHIKGISPLRAKNYLLNLDRVMPTFEDADPNPLSTNRGINTRDHFDVLRSDVMLVNLLGTTKADNPTVSIGTVAEMAWAWDRGIPQVVAMEPGYDNIHAHAMLNSWIDFRVETLDDAIKTVISIVSSHDSEMTNNIAAAKLAFNFRKFRDKSNHENLRTKPKCQ